MSSQDIHNTVAQLKRGGTWTDENLEESLDWQGDRGSISAKEVEGAQLIPRTHKEVEVEILDANNLSADVIAIIVNRVEKQLLKSSGAEGRTLTQIVDSRVDKQRKDIDTWLAAQSKRLSDMEDSTSAANDSTVKKIEEKIVSLEYKLDTLAGSIVQHGAEEVRLIHEAYKVIMDRKSSDTPDEGESEPSIYKRMDERVNALTESMKKVEPFADRAVQVSKATIASNANVKRKFGRML